jgi:hypothetical protein
MDIILPHGRYIVRVICKWLANAGTGIGRIVQRMVAAIKWGLAPGSIELGRIIVSREYLPYL